MKNFFRLTFLGVALLFSSTLAKGDESNAAKPSQIFSNIVEALSREDRKPTDFGNETFNAWSFANHPSDTKTAILGVAVLWKKNQRALVELAWWRQKNPEVRKCILLLYYAMTKVEASNFPDFISYSERFDAHEAAERKREIDEVLKIADSCRPLLLKSFKSS